MKMDEPKYRALTTFIVRLLPARGLRGVTGTEPGMEG